MPYKYLFATNKTAISGFACPRESEGFLCKHVGSSDYFEFLGVHLIFLLFSAEPLALHLLFSGLLRATPMKLISSPNLCFEVKVIFESKC